MKRLAPFLVLLAGILWGLIGIFVRRLNDMGYTSMEIVTLRAITTTVLLAVFLLIYNRTLLALHSWKDLWCFVGTGIVSIVFFNFCYFKAITMTSLSVAAVLLYTAPVIVMILSAVLFREKITIVKIIALIATFGGCVFVSDLIGSKERLSIWGILVGLGAGLGYALYSIFGRYALEKQYHPLTITFYTFLFAMVGTLPFTKVTVYKQAFLTDWKTTGFVFLFGLLSTVIPYIVYTLGLRELENSTASILASIEPVTATVLGIVVYHEISLMHILGIALVLVAIVISNLKTKKSEV